MDCSPIFIGGLDHSGKTLLRLSLSSHPNIVMTRRTYMWRHFHNRFGDLAEPDNFEQCLSAMLQKKAIRFLEPDPARIRREFFQGPERTYARLFSLLHEQFAERFGKTRWGEQEGSIEHFTRQIFEVYPNAKLIHMLRDPRARYGDERKSGSTNRPGRVGSRTAEWLASVQTIAPNLRHYPGRYMLVQFEQLLKDPEGSLREICEFLEEDYSPAMATLQGAIRFGPGDEADPDQGWSASRIKKYLSASDGISSHDLAFIENHAGEWMERYGYALAKKPLTFIQSLRYYVELPMNLMRMNSRHYEENERGI